MLALSLERPFLFVNNYHCLLCLEQHRRVCYALSSVTANQCAAAWRMHYARWKGVSDTAHFSNANPKSFPVYKNQHGWRGRICIFSGNEEDQDVKVNNRGYIWAPHWLLCLASDDSDELSDQIWQTNVLLLFFQSKCLNNDYILPLVFVITSKICLHDSLWNAAHAKSSCKKGALLYSLL